MYTSVQRKRQVLASGARHTVRLVLHDGANAVGVDLDDVDLQWLIDQLREARTDLLRQEKTDAATGT